MTFVVSAVAMSKTITYLGSTLTWYTVIFSIGTRALNELLRLTEQVSSQYGLKLNRDISVAIAMNNDGNIHFQDNTLL